MGLSKALLAKMRDIINDEPRTLKLLNPDDIHLITDELNKEGYDFDIPSSLPDHTSIEIEVSKEDLQEVQWRIENEYEETEQTLRLKYALWEAITGGATYRNNGKQYTMTQVERRDWNKDSMDSIRSTLGCPECGRKTFYRYRIPSRGASTNCDHCSHEIVLTAE